MALASRNLFAPAQVAGLEPKRALLIVTLANPGESGGPLAKWAADCLAQDLGVQVSIREQPLVIPKEAFHPTRGQADAVRLVEVVEQLVVPEQAVLGLTEYDLHSPLRRDLPYAMGARKGWAGLVSTYRMEDRRDAENTVTRLRKMLVRYGAELTCDAQRVPDPQDVLYESLQRPEQLDIMKWPS